MAHRMTKDPAERHKLEKKHSKVYDNLDPVPEGFMSPHEAMRYFGVARKPSLERIVVTYEIEVEVDKAGEITAVSCEMDPLKHALFEEHHRTVGWRPDDKEKRRRIEAAEKAARTRAKNRRAKDRRRLMAKRARRARGRASTGLANRPGGQKRPGDPNDP